MRGASEDMRGEVEAGGAGRRRPFVEDRGHGRGLGRRRAGCKRARGSGTILPVLQAVARQTENAIAIKELPERVGFALVADRVILDTIYLWLRAVRENSLSAAAAKW